MSLTANGLSAAIKSSMGAYPWAPESIELQQFCDALSTAIVTYLKANASVQPGTMSAGGDAVTGAGTIT